MEVEKFEKDKFYVSRTPFPLPVVHIRQRYRWDCGVTCVLMVLPPEKRHELMTRFHEVCREEGFGNSTWTIDLCYLLKRYGVKHHMYTTVLGVNEAHRNNHYYDKIFDLIFDSVIRIPHIRPSFCLTTKDSARVRRRFSSASRLGVPVTLAQWGPEFLFRHLNKGHSAIVLIDGTMLACDLCKHNKLSLQFRSWFGGTYSGHYVVVVSCSESHVWFLDPAAAHCACAATVSRFMTACKQRGTDYDLILVYNERDKS